jgi:capsular polysaccharide biosynthesis protein
MVKIASIIGKGCELLGVLEGHHLRRSPPHLISHKPPSEFGPILQQGWSQLCIKVPPINIYKLSNVFVCDQGIVFTEDGDIVEETIHETPPVAVKNLTTQIKSIADNGYNGQVVNKAVLIKKYGSTNYGHFLYEMAPKLHALRLAGIEDNCRFVLHDCPTLNCAATDLFEMAGINRDQLIFSDSDPLRVEELIIVTGLSHHSIFASPVVQDFYDGIADDVEAGPQKNIYLTRKGASCRKFLDDKLVELIIAKNNFDIVYPEHMTFREQIQLFKGASNIIGISGAAFTNCLFCQPGSQLLCIMPENALEMLFWQLSNIGHLFYTEWRVSETGSQVGGLPWDKNLIVDLTVLDGILKSFLDLRSGEKFVSGDFDMSNLYH